MGSSFRLLVFVVLLGVGRSSAFVDGVQNDADGDIDELLAAFSDANRLSERGSLLDDIDVDEKLKKDIWACIAHVMEENVGEDELPDSKISKCMAECTVYIRANGYFDRESFPDPMCLIDEPEERETAMERVLQKKKWRPFKKIGAWFKKNKDKIIKGLKIAAKIIGGIIKIFAGKK